MNCLSITDHCLWNIMRNLFLGIAKADMHFAFKKDEQHDKKVILQNYSGFYCY